MIQGKAFAPSIDSVNDRFANNGRSDWLFHDVRSECGDGADDHRSSSEAVASFCYEFSMRRQMR
jgi:hypothetical protein